MEITNFSVINPILKRHHHLFPKHLRALIVGKSSSGKSTLLYNLLLKPWLDYNNLIVFGKSLHQSEYQVIKAGFEYGLDKEQIANVFNNQEPLLEAGISPIQAIQEYTGPKNSDINVSFFSDCEQIPDPSELDPEKKNYLFWTTVIWVGKTKQRRIIPEEGITIVIPYFYPKIILDFLDKL